jgi:hypothetical protein
MNAENLKIEIAHNRVYYKAIEKNVEVIGSDADGWNVWVTEGNRTTLINAKINGVAGKYKTSSLAMAKANRYLNGFVIPEMK